LSDKEESTLQTEVRKGTSAKYGLRLFETRSNA
jgi:hypothetical protein